MKNLLDKLACSLGFHDWSNKVDENEAFDWSNGSIMHFVGLYKHVSETYRCASCNKLMRKDWVERVHKS